MEGLNITQVQFQLHILTGEGCHESKNKKKEKEKQEQNMLQVSCLYGNPTMPKL